MFLNQHCLINSTMTANNNCGPYTVLGLPQTFFQQNKFGDAVRFLESKRDGLGFELPKDLACIVLKAIPQLSATLLWLSSSEEKCITQVEKFIEQRKSSLCMVKWTEEIWQKTILLVVDARIGVDAVLCYCKDEGHHGGLISNSIVSVAGNNSEEKKIYVTFEEQSVCDDFLVHQLHTMDAKHLTIKVTKPPAAICNFPKTDLRTAGVDLYWEGPAGKVLNGEGPVEKVLNGEGPVGKPSFWLSDYTSHSRLEHSVRPETLECSIRPETLECSIRPETLECPICLETLEGPVILPCHHALCCGCAAQLVKDGALVCPFDRIEHPVPWQNDRLATAVQERVPSSRNVLAEKSSPPVKVGELLFCKSCCSIVYFKDRYHVSHERMEMDAAYNFVRSEENKSLGDYCGKINSANQELKVCFQDLSRWNERKELLKSKISNAATAARALVTEQEHRLHREVEDAVLLEEVEVEAHIKELELLIEHLEDSKVKSECDGGDLMQRLGALRSADAAYRDWKLPKHRSPHLEAVTFRARVLSLDQFPIGAVNQEETSEVAFVVLGLPESFAGSLPDDKVRLLESRRDGLGIIFPDPRNVTLHCFAEFGAAVLVVPSGEEQTVLAGLSKGERPVSPVAVQWEPEVWRRTALLVPDEDVEPEALLQYCEGEAPHGGPVAHVIHRRKNCRRGFRAAYVTFKEKSVFRSFLCHQRHEIDGKTIKVVSCPLALCDFFRFLDARPAAVKHEN